MKVVAQDTRERFSMVRTCLGESFTNLKELKQTGICTLDYFLLTNCQMSPLWTKLYNQTTYVIVSTAFFKPSSETLFNQLKFAGRSNKIGSLLISLLSINITYS